MSHSTTETFKMKREILNYSGKISDPLRKPERKFFADMLFGILASGSCLLSEITQELHESTKKINTVDRLSRHLAKGIPEKAEIEYRRFIRRKVPAEPVVYIDDSDIVKPEGYHFEALGIVRDGSASSNDKNVYEKGYHVTEACVMTDSCQPISLFSRIHSSSEKSFTSINDITFAAIDRAATLFKKCTFAMDRGYDDNKIFLKLLDEKQNFVIRIRKSRKLYYQNRWFPTSELCARRKGKIKMCVRYKGADHEAWLSHVKVRLTASKREVNLVLVYGLSDSPMMLVTNKPIRSKKDVKAIAKVYFHRWRIEEYFRAKKQLFQFENFRVRSLTAINALNFFLSLAMTFLTCMSLKNTSSLFQSIIEASRPIKTKVLFLHYRIELGIQQLLSYARTGVKDWFKPTQANRDQYRLRLPA